MQNKKEMNIVLAVVICLLFIGALVFISIQNKVNTAAPITNTINNADNTMGTSTNETGVAKAGDTVSVNYTGKLENGTVFDSNVDPKFGHVQPFEFHLGAGEVIPGWDKGIVGMKVGEKKTLTIAPADAYGATGVPGAIPPNSTLIFDVELLGIK